MSKDEQLENLIASDTKRKIILDYDFKYEFHQNSLELEISSNRVIAIAKKSKVDYIILNKGTAKRYNTELLENGIGLILNYNSKNPFLKDIHDICTLEDIDYFNPKGVLFRTFISEDFNNIDSFNQVFSHLLDSNKFICGNVIVSGTKSQYNSSAIEDLVYSLNAAQELGYNAFIISDLVGLDELEEILLASEIDIWLAIKSINDVEDLLHRAKEYRELGISGIVLGKSFLSLFDSPKVITSLRKVFVDKKSIDDAIKEVQTTN